MVNNKREIESNGYKTDHTLTINLSKYLNHTSTSSNVMFKAILKDNYIEMYKLFSKRTSLHFDSYFRRRVCENQFEFHRLSGSFPRARIRLVFCYLLRSLYLPICTYSEYLYDKPCPAAADTAQHLKNKVYTPIPQWPHSSTITNTQQTQLQLLPRRGLKSTYWKRTQKPFKQYVLLLYPIFSQHLISFSVSWVLNFFSCIKESCAVKCTVVSVKSNQVKCITLGFILFDSVQNYISVNFISQKLYCGKKISIQLKSTFLLVQCLYGKIIKQST